MERALFSAVALAMLRSALGQAAPPSTAPSTTLTLWEDRQALAQKAGFNGDCKRLRDVSRTVLADAEGGVEVSNPDFSKDYVALVDIPTAPLACYLTGGNIKLTVDPSCSTTACQSATQASGHWISLSKIKVPNTYRFEVVANSGYAPFGNYHTTLTSMPSIIIDFVGPQFTLRRLAPHNCVAYGCYYDNVWRNHPDTGKLDAQGQPVLPGPSRCVSNVLPPGSRKCYCDDACTSFKDCCEDYQDTCIRTLNWDYGWCSSDKGCKITPSSTATSAPTASSVG